MFIPLEQYFTVLFYKGEGESILTFFHRFQSYEKRSVRNSVKVNTFYKK